MNPLGILLGLIVCIILLLALLIVILLNAQSRIDPVAYKEIQKLKRLLPIQKKKVMLSNVADRLYPVLRKTPGINQLLLANRYRLMRLYADDEYLIRAQSASLTITACAVVLGTSCLALLFTSTWVIQISIIAAAVYIASVISDMLVGRREKKLLYGLSGFLLDLRHEYHQTHMVIESLERASERSSPLVAAHARKLAEVLSSADPEEELRKYYDEAPNRYTKLLAGVGHLILENGDGVTSQDKASSGERSLYLNALSKINEEIRMDILRREKLEAQLAGIVFIAFSPLFLIEPLRGWGENSFPAMRDYYESRWGMYSLILLYVLMGISFIGLRLVMGLDGASGQGRANRGLLWRLLRKPFMGQVVDRITPPSYSAEYFRTFNQIQDANESISVKELYTRKWLIACCTLVIFIAIQLYMHDAARTQLLQVPEVSQGAGPITKGDVLEAQRLEFKGQVIREALELELAGNELVEYMNEQMQGKPFVPSGVEYNKFADELVGAVHLYRNETYRWYELMIALGIAYLGYWIPNLILFFRRSMRKWEMQNESDGFTAIVSILAALPRISVIEILDWMHRYSRIFEPQLLRCLMDYEAGPLQALEQLKEEVKFVPLERVIDRLLVAAELIPVRKAFDDIENERAFELEQRKLQYEGMISRKVSIGKLIGFLPLQATFALYLMVPFAYMAVQQLGNLSGVTNGL